jgi:hypothetical protein
VVAQLVVERVFHNLVAVAGPLEGDVHHFADAGGGGNIVKSGVRQEIKRRPAVGLTRYCHRLDSHL